MQKPMVLLFSCAAIAAAATGETGIPEKNIAKLKLLIRVVDLANTPAWMLRKASALTQTLLSEAGVDVEWLPTCRIAAPQHASLYSPDCAAALRGVAAELVIRLLDDNMTSPQVSDLALAYTNLQTGGIYVYEAHIRTSHLAETARRYALLGLVMAHETGHYLGLKHAGEGVMRSEFRPMDVEAAALSRLQFSREEAVKLRDGAARWTGTSSLARAKSASGTGESR